jgi:hypothetical protein
MPITLGNPFKGRHYSGEVILLPVRPHDAAFYSPVQLPVFFDPATIRPVVVSANHGGREPEMMIPSGATRIGFVHSGVRRWLPQ